MRAEYYEIYGDLYDMYRRRWFDMPYMPERHSEFGPLFESRALRWTTEAIEYSISELGLTKQVRPDAKHFLLVNLHQLIVLPLIHPEGRTLPVQELRNMLRKDVRTVLEYSLKTLESNIDNKGEISSGHILKTISNIWNDLSLNRIDVWG